MLLKGVGGGEENVIMLTLVVMMMVMVMMIMIRMRRGMRKETKKLIGATPDK